ncbi:MAG: metallophosphoesterase family protein [Mangrovibacterium sp.]|nr:metallophosphoesterase family protein [Mangrovibacterium sp.]
MKKTIGIVAALMVMIMPVRAGGPSKNLRFDTNGKFKVVQFTDIHFQYDSYRSDSALILMKQVIQKEKPDLVVLTGDVVCSKNTVKAWLALSRVLIDAKVPWAVTLGNHDVEYELTGKQIMETIGGLPYNLTVNGPEHLSGNGNYILEIKASKSTDTAALLYFLDSHSSFKPKGDMGTYEWVAFDQIAWYREQSKNFTQKNGGTPYPALAFFHIPLPEYKEIIGKKTTVGIQEETVCSPDFNSGLFTAMLESKDVMGMFTGHDHNNNYAGVLYDICMAYGNVTGRQCYGKIGRGARVIELHENARKFDTWILKLYECDRDKDIWTRTNDDSKKLFVTYPDSFVEK